MTDEIQNYKYLVNTQHMVSRKVSFLINYHLMRNTKPKFTERRNSFISFLSEFGDFSIDSLKRNDLHSWFLKIKEKNNYSDRTLFRIRDMVNQFFKFLMTEEIIKVNPIEGITFDRNCPTRRKRTILSKDEVNYILTSFKEYSPHCMYPFIFVLAHTGARLGEILELKWDNVDSSNGCLIFIDTKNKVDRRVKVGATLLELILGLPGASEYVFKGEKFTKLGRTKVFMDVQSFKKKYPIEGKNWKCHDLRHSFAYNFLKNGRNMYELQAILGHKSIKMTIDLYGQLKSIDVENVSPYD